MHDRLFDLPWSTELRFGDLAEQHHKMRLAEAVANGVGRKFDTTFAALDGPTRRAILARLADGDAIITELAEPFAFSLPARRLAR